MNLPTNHGTSAEGRGYSLQDTEEAVAYEEAISGDFDFDIANPDDGYGDDFDHESPEIDADSGHVSPSGSPEQTFLMTDQDFQEYLQSGAPNARSRHADRQATGSHQLGSMNARVSLDGYESSSASDGDAMPLDADDSMAGSLMEDDQSEDPFGDDAEQGESEAYDELADEQNLAATWVEGPPAEVLDDPWGRAYHPDHAMFDLPQATADGEQPIYEPQHPDFPSMDILDARSQEWQVLSPAFQQQNRRRLAPGPQPLIFPAAGPANPVHLQHAARAQRRAQLLAQQQAGQARQLAISLELQALDAFDRADELMRM